jgi:hypothetical protein
MREYLRGDHNEVIDIAHGIEKNVSISRPDPGAER